MAALLTDKDADAEQVTDDNSQRHPPTRNTQAEPCAPQQSVTELAKIFKLLADETRLRILFILQRSPELNVLELCRELDQRQPSVSHHLALLRVAGLIAMRREGKHNFYRVLPQRFQEIVATVIFAAPENPLQVALNEFSPPAAPGESPNG